MGITVKGEESVKFNPTEVPVNRYTAKVKEIRELEIDDRPTLDFCFVIHDGEQAGKELSYLCSKKITEKTKLGEFVKMATGRGIEVDKDYDLDKIFSGQKFAIMTDTKERVDKDGKVTKNSFVLKVVERLF